MKLRPELLLDPVLPKPLHGMNPRKMISVKWWDTVRKEAMAKNDDCCWACGVHKSKQLYRNWIEGHEDYDINFKTGRVVLKEIVGLCHACHQFIHHSWLFVRFNLGEVGHRYAFNILRHGMGVIKEAGLPPRPGQALHYLLVEGRDRAEADSIVFDRKLLDIYPEPKKFADWDKWYIEIEGTKYHTEFKGQKEWHQKYYG